MKKPTKPRPDILLGLNFTIGHACPADETGIDWRDFELQDGGDEDFFVFICPLCGTHACISMGIDSSSKRLWSRTQWAAMRKPGKVSNAKRRAKAI